MFKPYSQRKAISINKPSRTKKITYDPTNYVKGIAENVYGDNQHKIKKQKIVETPRKTKIVDYGPVNYYGKQTKTKTIIRKK